MNQLSTRKTLAPIFVFMLTILAAMGGLLLETGSSRAGIYDGGSEVTYKEYWIPHSEFTGSCDSNSGGSWYVEPGACSKDLELIITDKITDAAKVEIYIDLWRARDGFAATYKVNDGPIRHAAVGSDWSRTPYVAEIPLGELKTGTNIITIGSLSGSLYHAHDISFRVYFDSDNKIYKANDQVIEAANIAGFTVDDGGGAVDANSGGTLDVDGNTVTFKVTTAYTGTGLIEVHGYYFGYDEDNDGLFGDWHNRNRNNKNPGGLAANPDTGGTIDHIGTTKITGAGTYTIVWDLKHVVEQSGVKFKVRIVDAEGVARDAAGGESAAFSLQRMGNDTALMIPNFEDGILHHSGIAPDIITREIILPADISHFDEAYLISSFWEDVKISINGGPDIWASNGDPYELSIKDLAGVGALNPLTNTISYKYANNGFGSFVEKPGPMIVLRDSDGGGSDTTPPVAYQPMPAAGTSTAKVNTDISLGLYDLEAGVDTSTIQMTVNGASVTPAIVPQGGNAIITYDPPVDFVPGQAITVTVVAADLAGNTMSQASYSFSIQALTSLVSDDFNSCALDPLLWSFYDPVAGTTAASAVVANGTQLKIIVPEGDVHDLWHTNTNAPRVTQPINNSDFSMEVKFDSVVTDTFQMQGLIVEEDADSFVRYNIQHAGPGLVEFVVAAYDNEDAILDSSDQLYFDKIAISNTAPYMMIERIGETWKTFHKFAAVDAWVKNAEFDLSLNPVSPVAAGVFAGNASVDIHNFPAPAHTAVVDYIFNTSAIIDPEDPVAPSVTVNWTPQNAGTVVKDVACGNPVQLTAIPEPGWELGTWGGAYTGSDNPAVVTFGYSETITATFVPASYTLNTVVMPPEGGVAAVSPEQATYAYAAVVDLSATSSTGWTFTGWGGGLNDPGANTSITMTGDITATASFEPIPYTVTVNSTGDGTGNVTTDAENTPGGYIYGTQVTLTAMPDSESTFGGWSGDSSESAISTTLVITGHMNVNALFNDRSITVNVTESGTGSGTVTVSDPANGSFYEIGETVTLTAIPDAGSSFAGWTGGTTSSVSSISVELTGDLSVDAAFTQDGYTLTVINIGSGTGQTSPTTSSGYGNGDVVSLSATPDIGSTFTGWGGDETGVESTIDVTMDGNKTIEAHFDLETYTLTAISGGTGSGVVSPESGTSFVHGSEITVEAIPDPGSQFVGWIGDKVSTDRAISVTMESDLSLEAIFSQLIYGITVTTNGDGNGFVAYSQPTTNGGYVHGDSVTITATANVGTFAGWSGDISGLANPTTFLLTRDMNITASFIQDPLSVSVTTNGEGSVDLEPNRTLFQMGEQVTFTAKPEVGWSFVAWGGELTGTANPIQLTVASDHNVSAIFTMDSYELDVISGNSAGGSVSVDIPGPYTYGQKVTLSAVAAPGYEFGGWSSNAELTDEQKMSPVLEIAVTGNHQYIATFGIPTGSSTEPALYLPVR